MTAILGTFFAFNILNYAKTIYAETKNENEKTASVEASTWSSASTDSSLNTGLNSQRTIDRLESSEATILAIGSSIAEVTTDRITNIGSNQISTLITQPLNTKVNIETSHFTRDSQSDSYPTEITVLSQSSIHDTKTSKSITNDIGTWPINSSSQVPTNNIKTTISVTAIGRTATTDNDPSQSSPNNIESTDSMESTRETELQTATITSQSNTTVTLMSDPVTITTAVTVNDRTATTNSNPTQSSLINTETTNSRFTMDKTRPTKPRTDTVTSQGITSVTLTV